MRVRFTVAGWIAAVAALLVYGLTLMSWLPWPTVAGKSLAAIFLLAAITRIGGDSGLAAQRKLRYAVAGVAWTAGTWFLLSAPLVGQPWLVGLALPHLLAGALALGGDAEPSERARGRVVLAATCGAISLLAVAVLPVGAHVPGAPRAPLGLATALLVGAFHQARGRRGGLVVAALGGVVSLVFMARLLAELVAHGAAAGFGRVAPVVVGTAALGAAYLVIAFARKLPALARSLAPDAPPGLRTLLVWLTLPAVAAVAIAVLIPT